MKRIAKFWVRIFDSYHIEKQLSCELEEKRGRIIYLENLISDMSQSEEKAQSRAYEISSVVAKAKREREQEQFYHKLHTSVKNW